MQSGVRFSSMMIPQAATIQFAHLKVVASDTVSVTTVNADIKVEDTDNALPFTTGANFAARVRSAIKVDWDNISGWTAGVTYQSPEIKTLIQRIVNRPGWQAGNAMVIFIEDDTSSADAYREFASYDHLTYVQAQLCVYFT